jgi:hypothetical protein
MSIQIMTKTTSCTAKGALLPMNAIPIGGAIGPNPKQLAGSARNQRNLIPAPAHSENAPAHWLLRVINNKCRTAQIRNNRSKLAVSAFQITQHKQAAQTQISQQIGDFLHI